MNRTLPRLALAGALFLTSASALADPIEVHVNEAWSRATPPTAEVGAAYFNLSAHGHGADRLVGASAPVAKKVELHTHVMEGNLMRMKKMEAVEVHPGAPVQFAPGGNHVMLIGLEAPLEEGDRFPLTLTFEKAGDVVVEVQVKGVGAMSAHGGHGAGSHSQMKDEGHGTKGHGHGHDKMKKQ